MSQNKILDKLRHISKIPKHGTDDYKQWVEQEEFLQFLLDTCESEIPLYVSYKGTYLYSVFLPQNCLRGNYIDDLLEWNCTPDSSWGYYNFPPNENGEPHNIPFSPPFDFSGSKLLKNATPITFLRSFEGRIGQKSYIEVLQLLTHLNGLHFIEEKNAYCRLNKDGDIGVCQGSCRVYHQAAFVITVPETVFLSRGGFSQTSIGRSQLRVSLDHRSGCLALAAS